MLMVVFQLHLSEDRGHAYLDLAAWLRPELLKIDGFLGNERWRSPTDPASLLALSSWRDEAAVLRWRKHTGHQLAQARGRGGCSRTTGCEWERWWRTTPTSRWGSARATIGRRTATTASRATFAGL